MLQPSCRRMLVLSLLLVTKTIGFGTPLLITARLLYLPKTLVQRFIEPVEGALVKEWASLDLTMFSRPFGIVETNQLLLRHQSVVD